MSHVIFSERCSGEVSFADKMRFAFDAIARSASEKEENIMLSCRSLFAVFHLLCRVEAKSGSERTVLPIDENSQTPLRPLVNLVYPA